MKKDVIVLKKVISRYWGVLLLMLFAVVLYSVINWLTPLWCDDLDYGAAGHTFGDIAHKEVHDYFHANGRICSHSLVQVFAGMLGKQWFNLLNPIMTLLMILLLPVASGEDFKAFTNYWRWCFLISLSLLMVWFVLPDQYITMFMIAGSSNYIWAAVLNLLFVYEFTQALTKEQTMNVWRWIGIAALSFFAGAWMEMYSIALAPALFLYLLLHKKDANKHVLIALACYVVGMALVVFAPGNFERQERMVFGHSSAFSWLVSQLELSIRFNLIWFWALTLALLIIECVKKNYSIKEFVKDNLIWIVGILVSYAFLYVSGVGTYRAQWAICLFSFVILFSVLRKVYIRSAFCIVISSFLLIVVFVDFIKEFAVCKEKNEAVSVMLEQAQTETLTEGSFYLWPQTSSSKKSIPLPTKLNGSWPGESFATFYHLDKFVIMPEQVYPYCKGDRQADSLHYGIVPMIDGWAIMKLKEKGSMMNLVCDYDVVDAYVFRSKASRLMAALGCDDVVRKVYDSDKSIFGILLEKNHTLESISSVSDGTEDVFVFDYYQSRYLAAPVSMIMPKYDAPIKNITLGR